MEGSKTRPCHIRCGTTCESGEKCSYLSAIPLEGKLTVTVCRPSHPNASYPLGSTPPYRMADRREIYAEEVHRDYVENGWCCAGGQGFG